MIYNKTLTGFVGCVLTVFIGLLSGTVFAEGFQPAASRPVLDRWAQTVAGKLAQINPAAPAIAPAVKSGPSLKPGMTGERVDRLAAQLVARGFLASDAYHGLYDLAMETAVSAFQTSVGVLADGIAGEGTIENLDRAPASTAAILKNTLAGMQSLAANAPQEFFLVNIPSQTAYLIQGDTVVMSMRTAVGRPSRPTPLLTDQVTDVVINPTWTAPSTVLAKDKLPSLRRTGHPGIEGATIYLDHQEVDPATVDWSSVTPERIKIVQSPGDQNALGRFKFNLTNGESIYMHDTNDHSVFARQGRALSSGCVRLAEPQRLAELLLGREGWSHEGITHAVDSEHTQYISLHHPLPVRFVYWQASVDDGGEVRIHKDIYGMNSQLLAAAPRHTQIAEIASPRPLFVGQPNRQTAAPAAATPADSGLFDGLFDKLMALMPTTAPAPQPDTTKAPRLEQQVAIQSQPQADSTGWGLY